MLKHNFINYMINIPYIFAIFVTLELYKFDSTKTLCNVFNMYFTLIYTFNFSQKTLFVYYALLNN